VVKTIGYVRTVVLQTQPQRILTTNPDRQNFTIKNDHVTATIYYGYDQNVATSGDYQGLKISAGGQGVEERFWTGEVWAISDTADTRISVIENVKVSGGEVEK